MKKIFIILLSLTLLTNCSDEVNYDADNYSHLIDLENPPVISFDETKFDFGKIIEGELVNHKFSFTNTGSGVLVISSVNASCGCTIPKNWPKGPVKPGEGGTIEVEFNSENRVGIANKVITVTSNTKPSATKIALTGEVVGPN